MPKKPITKKVLKRKGHKNKPLVPISSIKKTKVKSWRPSGFQIKSLFVVVAVFLNFRYDISADSFRDQDIQILVIIVAVLLIKPSPFYRLIQKFSYPKLMWVLIFATFIVPTIAYVESKYQDWDNAQMIKGLARDFPELVSQIEAGTGLDLEIKRDCMITSEKSGSGVRTCELSYVLSENPEKFPIIDKILSENKIFSKISSESNGAATRYMYKNIKSCTFTDKKTIYGSCLFAVREANAQLAIDQLSE